jgi:DNA-binding response OmpR family regulator
MPKVLIIDDSRIIRDLLCDFLTEQGYEVDTAEDGLDGIIQATDTDYDIVFCDIHMPRRNGFQVYCEVSAQKPNTVFIMTDSLPDELAEKAKNAGAFTILTKPFDLDQVRDTLARIGKQVEV